MQLNNITKSIEVSKEIAKANMRQARAKYTHQYNKRSRNPTFQVNDKVLLHKEFYSNDVSPKLQQRWIGPFKVVKVFPNFTYKLENVQTGKQLVHVVHANRLKKFFERFPVADKQRIQVGNQRDNPEVNEHQNNAQDKVENVQADTKVNRVIDRLLQCVINRGRRMYKVKWLEESGRTHTTWEYAESIPQVLRDQFHVKKTMSGKAKRKRYRR